MEDYKEMQDYVVYSLKPNDIIFAAKLIEVGQSKGKILASEMKNVGILYERICSYVQYLQDKDNQQNDQFLKQLAVDDLIILSEYIGLMRKRELFLEEEEKLAVDKLIGKINETFKFLYDNKNESFDPSQSSEPSDITN